MQYSYRGYLYFHGDSRGGSVFVEGESQRDALVRYAEGFGYDRNAQRLAWDDDGDFDAEKWLSGLQQEDLVGPAIITSETPFERGQELDGTFNGDCECDENTSEYLSGKTAWALGQGEDDNHAEPGPDGVVRVYYGERPGEPHYLPRFTDDAWGLIFVPAGEAFR